MGACWSYALPISSQQTLHTPSYCGSRTAAKWHPGGPSMQLLLGPSTHSCAPQGQSEACRSRVPVRPVCGCEVKMHPRCNCAAFQGNETVRHRATACLARTWKQMSLSARCLDVQLSADGGWGGGRATRAQSSSIELFVDSAACAMICALCTHESSAPSHDREHLHQPVHSIHAAAQLEWAPQGLGECSRSQKLNKTGANTKHICIHSNTAQQHSPPASRAAHLQHSSRHGRRPCHPAGHPRLALTAEVAAKVGALR